MILSLIIYIFLCFMTYIFIIRNLIIIIYYKHIYGDSCKIIFRPILGYFSLLNESFKQYGNSFTLQRNWQKENKDLKLIIFLSGFSTLIFINDIELIKAFTQSLNGPNFVKVESIFLRDLFISDSIFFNEQKRWKRQRNFFSKHFHFTSLKNKVPLIKDITRLYLQKLPNDGQTPVQIIEEIQNVASEVIFRTFFGQSLNGKNINGHSIVREIQELISEGAIYKKNSLIYLLKLHYLGSKNAYKYFQTSFEKKYIQRAQKYVNKIEECILEAQENIKEELKNDNFEGKNFLEIYLHEYQKQQSQKGLKDYEKITYTEIVHQFNTLFFAGMDTTANTTGSGAYFMALYPEIQEKCRQEVNSLVQNFEDLTYEDLTKMNYLNAFMKETLRLVPAASTIQGRIALKDTYINDFKIFKDVMVTCYVEQFNEEKFPQFINADKFWPERFLGEIGENEIPYSFIPFSAGPRNCIGQHLATIEFKIIMVFLLKNYKIIKNEKASDKFQQVFLFRPYDKDLIKLQKL